MKPVIEEFDRVLLVEGYSDLRFYAEVLEHVGKQDQVFIKEFRGREHLLTNLEAFVTPRLLSQKTALAVIVDADEDAGRIERRLAEALARLTGQEISVGGWTNGQPRIGLLVVPGGGAPGEIESLVWQAWAEDPGNRDQRACIEDFVNCMAGAGAKARSPHKGLISALLAIRNDEDPRLGPGAQANVFDFDRPEYAELSRFLAQF